MISHFPVFLLVDSVKLYQCSISLRGLIDVALKQDLEFELYRREKKLALRELYLLL